MEKINDCIRHLMSSVICLLFYYTVVGLLQPQGCLGAQHCGPGHSFKIDTDGIEGTCTPCKPGFFIDKTEHREPFCERCSVFDEYAIMMKQQVDECTIFHDIKVRCINNYYFNGDDCYVCTNCEVRGLFEGQPCTPLNDTVCCDSKYMVVLDGKCVARTEHTTVLEESRPATCKCPDKLSDYEICLNSVEVKDQQKCSNMFMSKTTTVFVISIGILVAFCVGVCVGKRLPRIRNRI